MLKQLIKNGAPLEYIYIKLPITNIVERQMIINGI